MEKRLLRNLMNFPIYDEYKLSCGECNKFYVCVCVISSADDTRDIINEILTQFTSLQFITFLMMFIG